MVFAFFDAVEVVERLLLLGVIIGVIVVELIIFGGEQGAGQAPPKPDPVFFKKQAEEKARQEAAEKEKDRQAAIAKEKARQRDLAKKRVAEKMRKERAAEAAAAKKAAAEAKRVAVRPTSRSRKSPRYPSSSRRAGHQGITIITFVVGTSGTVTSARITKSSGHAALDQAAISAVRTWRFTPARNGLGQAIP